MLQVISLVFVFASLLGPIMLAFRLFRKRERCFAKWCAIAVASAFACYCCLLISVALTEVHLECELNRFDLNGNGSFSGEELTPEMKSAMKRVTNDTGRTFAPITGAIISPLYCSFWFAVFCLTTILNANRRDGQKGEQSTAGGPLETPALESTPRARSL